MGIFPDIMVPVTYENFMKNVDGKLKKAKEMIMADK